MHFRAVAVLPVVLILLAAVFAACGTAPGPMTPAPADVEPAPAASPRVADPATERAPTPLAERRAPDPRNVVYDPALFGDLEWHSIGPARGGRVTAVTGVIGQPGTYYFGATGGGVWKTTDYGRSWRNLSDGWFETGSIGAVRVAESDPSVVWVATGSDGLRSNVITGLGVYRSTDAGETWRFTGLRDIGNTGAIEVDPRDPDVAYVAAIGHPFGPNPERGLYRTRDGGATWENVLFISDSAGIVDVEIDPSDPDVLYASSWRGERKPWTIISGGRRGGVYRSTDGGDTWLELGVDAADPATAPAGPVAAAGSHGAGLPTGNGDLFGKIDLAVARSNPATVYALIEAPDPADGLYRSDDAGATWRQVSSDTRLTARAFYYTNVDVDPTDPETVWVNAHLRLHRSTDGGATWETVRTPHGDNHDIWIDPSNPDLMVQGNDGGANVSTDGARSWSTQDNQPTAELYSVDLDDAFPYWAYSGQQDASAIGVASRPPAVGSNQVYLGCETGPAVPKPGDPDVVYNSCKGRFMVWNRETGENRNYWIGARYMYGHAARDLDYRMQRVSPIEVSPHDPDRVYYGTQYVMVTGDHGVSWTRLSDDLTATPPGTQGVSGEPITRDITGEEVYSTLYAIAESPVRPGIIWVGSYDGPFHVSTDNGDTWREITPPDLPAGGRVQSIDPSPHDPGTAIYSVLRWLLDDWRPYVYRTRDYGRSWERLTDGANGIPADYPVRVAREDPVRPGLLYAGTEFGFYVSFDDGARWQPLQLDLPATPVTDIAFAPGPLAWGLPESAVAMAPERLLDHLGGDLVISTMGRGFWVLRDLAPLRQLDDDIAAGPDGHLFGPGTATLATWGGWGGYGGGPEGLRFEYGQPGAVVDWVLAEAPDRVTVELLDDAGSVINGWTSDADGFALPAHEGTPGEEAAMRAGGGVVRGGPRVDRNAGHTRFTVPLQHPGPWQEGRDDGGPGADPDGALSARGPAVAPGQYAVRVTADDWSQTRPLTVVMDPRTREIGVAEQDLEEQEQLALAVRDLLSRARQRLAGVEAALESASGLERQRLTALHEQLTARDTHYPQPMLVEQIQYLYGMITDTAQKPGIDAFERYDELAEWMERLDG